MAPDIINSNLTETYYLDLNDSVIVKPIGSVVTDDLIGIGNRTDTDIGVSVQVQGRVQTDWVGVSLVSGSGVGAGQGVRSYVSVGETGSVSAQLGVQVNQDFGADVRVAGNVSGSFGGMSIAAVDSTLRIQGEIRGESHYGLEIESQVQTNPIGFVSVFNAGTIKTEDGVGVSIQDAGGEFRNIATVSGGTGIYVVSNQELLIRNEGTVFANFRDGIGIAYGQELATINNSGVIDATRFAIKLGDADARVVNSGTMSGEIGIWVDSSDLFLRNSGVITGSTQAIFSHGQGARDVVNDGLIAGDIDGVESYESWHLTNHGTIAGDIRLGFGDDSYKLGQTGIMTGEVFGGHGEDILIGNDQADRLYGEDGDDWLRGRGGDDMLNGGLGEDRLQGGDGDDVLDGGMDYGDTDRMTGGAGADIFVFGEESGRDRVTDFEDGTDLLRLVGHVGGFDALAISDQNGNRLIEHDNGSIVLVGLGGLMLTSADFDFVVV